jgi:hypothetical protein
MNIFYGLLIWTGGLILGFFLRVWIGRVTGYTGTIFVSREAQKTVYTLELEEYPDEIRFKKEVVFKVDASHFDEVDISEKSPNRE